MNECPPLEDTRNLVRLAFYGKFDDQGVPFYEHMRRVADRLPADLRLQTVAWLHDIVEDTKVTLDDIKDLYPEEIVEAVALLTHNRKEMDYQSYIDRLCNSGNAIAIRVKIADQEDNLNPKRHLGVNTFKLLNMLKKWDGVLPKLWEALYALR